MGGYRFLEHEDEAGIEAWGQDMAEAFAQAAEGLFALMVVHEGIEERASRQVEVTAPDAEALLVEWLNELLFLFETEGWLFRRFAIREISDTALEAEGYGEHWDPGRHLLRLGVKAATYHETQVERDGECRVQIIVDV